jgi:hypothetical protein
MDACKVATITASAGASTNGLNFPLYVHKVQLAHADGTAQARVELFDAATATGTAVIDVEANEVTDGTSSVFEVNRQVDFPVPLFCENGLASTITNSAIAKVYYSRA